VHFIPQQFYILSLSNTMTMENYSFNMIQNCVIQKMGKVLARRMKEVLPILIDETQSAFIEGRHLLQSTLIANEVIHKAKTRNKPCLVFKVDYEKAYDSVSWEFLLYMLRRMGFCENWISWIEGCLKSASISILSNSSLTSEFTPPPPKRSKTRGRSTSSIFI